MLPLRATNLGEASRIDGYSHADSCDTETLRHDKEPRPARQLIEALNDIDPDLLEKVSPSSTILRTFVKLPMLFLLFNAGLWSGIGAVSLKLCGELAQAGEMGQHWFLLGFMASFMTVSVFAITHSTNMAMKFYD